VKVREGVAVAVGVLDGVIVGVKVFEGVTVNVDVKVEVGVLDGVIVNVGVKVNVGVLEGLMVGVEVFDGVSVKVAIAHNGAESDRPDGLLVFTVSSYSLTYLICGNCFSEALKAGNRLYEFPSVEHLPAK
jgi:hypothetical protein